MEQTIEAVRTFNRFYTRYVGALDARFLGSDMSLPEARLLLEIARREPVQANMLQDELDLDRGYLSRMVSRFEQREWISRDRSATDSRSRPIRLTPAGRAAFAAIDRRQHDVIAAALSRLTPAEQHDLTEALSLARCLLAAPTTPHADSDGQRRASLEMLDRPVWNALAGRQAPLSIGTPNARRFDPAIGPFGAARRNTAGRLATLARLSATDDLWLVEKEPIAAPDGAVIVHSAECLQMVAAHVSEQDRSFPFRDLGEADAADMLALATLTAPGPFRAGTWRLGGFIGIRDNGRLVAMAGERLKPGNFTEISGVCTHPEYRGRGYAGFLMRVVAKRILARGEQPFLHSYANNAGAIALYESLGFRAHQRVTATVIRRT
ncbi:GNAT family N-acetyltransferase [Gluconacetobacter azotocaptans]|uniref:GNAT family N-acetyltransferase n=1 Tax=Gluconacetobacter azotocaptans TaxID=142834 RepID=UPI00195B02B0|nr:GNAT family N-acetyltransferase [Gluconacetobacter azotocaptans]MBM9403585.1 GNAT family N-acetyltransferase [Gluconacetobacter azotocaptans]